MGLYNYYVGLYFFGYFSNMLQNFNKEQMLLIMELIWNSRTYL